MLDILIAKASGARRPDLKRPALAVCSNFSAGVARLYARNIDSQFFWNAKSFGCSPYHRFDGWICVRNNG
jgi:hypothetical protein